jgi:uncharacterized protein YwqG
VARLMIATEAEPSSGGTRVGGVPLAPPGFEWPRCAECKGAMQFLAQVFLRDTGVEAFSAREQLLLLFQCQNNPGACEEWDPEAGGNAALLVPAAGAAPVVPPPVTEEEKKAELEGPRTLLKAQGVALQEFDDAGEDAYAAALNERGGAAIGRLGGRPSWIQGDETPECDCGAAMTFVAQIEDHAGGGINFGDAGAGYAFVCEQCEERARFLWQCG